MNGLSMEYYRTFVKPPLHSNTSCIQLVLYNFMSYPTHLSTMSHRFTFLVYCVIGMCAIHILNLRSYLKMKQFNIYTMDQSSSYTTFVISYSPVHNVTRVYCNCSVITRKGNTPFYFDFMKQTELRNTGVRTLIISVALHLHIYR